MSYGKDKVKDMVKSILPSKRRKTARSRKKQVYGAERARVRQMTAALQKDPEAFDDGVGDWDNPDIEINNVRAERRVYDKVEPLMKWAPKVTKGAPDKRLAQMRAILPKNTIGQHALSHLRGLDKFRENPLEFKSRNDYKQPKMLTDKERAEKLRLVIERYGMHRRFNRSIHSTRKLVGMHDIEKFLVDLRKEIAERQKILWAQGLYLGWDYIQEMDEFFKKEKL